jgi:hypothetical protein
MAVSQEQVGEVRADEARAAGDQDDLPHGGWWSRVAVYGRAA